MKEKRNDWKRKRKQNFGRATLMKNERKLRIVKLRNEKEADGTVRKRNEIRR